MEQRGKLFQRLDGRNGEWSADEVEEAKWICRRMEDLCCLAPFLGAQTILDAWDDPLAKAWLILKPIVKDCLLYTSPREF